MPHYNRGEMKRKFPLLRFSWAHQPYVLLSAVIFTPVGLTAIILGDGVSKALSYIAVGYVSRFMGVLLFIGGALVFYGVTQAKVKFETLGLASLSVGCGVYSFGVVIGLGTQGILASSGFLILAVAAARRLVTIATSNSTTIVRDTGVDIDG